MQKWNYLHIVCEEGRPRYINRQEIPNWQQGLALWEVVNYLFRNGWESVDNPSDPDAKRWVYHPGLPHHFRRPK